jgi:hypothetical protein
VIADDVQVYLNMLRAHNSKTLTVINGFKKYQQLRERCKNEGIPFEQLIAEQHDAPAKKKKKLIKFKQPKASVEPEIEIKVKGADG